MVKVEETRSAEAAPQGYRQGFGHSKLEGLKAILQLGIKELHAVLNLTQMKTKAQIQTPKNRQSAVEVKNRARAAITWTR